MVKRIFKYIVNNKRIMYFSCIGILLVFCLILNYTFSLFTIGANNISANITVGDLDYKMIINAVELDDSVGIKDRTNTIIGDRIIKLKNNSTEQFNVLLSSLNNMDTKYEIIYNFCKDSSCKEFIDDPDNVHIYYPHDNMSINGVILSKNQMNIQLITQNNSDIDYYVQVGLNAGYEHNDLVLYNKINQGFKIGIRNGGLELFAYVNGEPVDSFPTEDNFDVNVKCYHTGTNTLSTARGIGKWSGEWIINVYGLTKTDTYCEVLFEEKTQITYSILALNYNCSNKPDVVKNPIIDYTGDCAIYNDATTTTNSSEGDWRVKFLTSGTLRVNGNIWVDLFIVGGGGGGGQTKTNYRGHGGGGGGYTLTQKNIRLFAYDDDSNGTEVNEYEIIVGDGGASQTNGNPTKAFGYEIRGGYAGVGESPGNGGSGGGQGGYSFDYPAGKGGSYGGNGYNTVLQTSTSTPTASSGQGTTTCEFGEGTTSSCINGTSFAYSGGGGGGSGQSTNYGGAAAGGVGGGGAGGRGGAGGAGGTNTGGGGGGGSEVQNNNSGMAGGKGGSGVVIIRNVRS